MTAEVLLADVTDDFAIFDALDGRRGQMSPSSSLEAPANQLGNVKMRGVEEKGTWIGTAMVSSSALKARGVALEVLARSAAEIEEERGAAELHL